ncbi:MAG TPA: Smr/MutS family protein [Stellaceae bacterium]|nr:Smr/MutS family protein [Stellaceae bacterium]
MGAGEGAGSGETPAVPARPPSTPLPPLDRFAGVDRATAERLKRGRMRTEARLDLHGMTQAEAHRALAGFVARSRAGGRRCLLVITGHGRMSGGVLKTAVPRWLGEPDLRRHVLAIAPARPEEGGSGALYVLLRRLPQARA